MIPLAEQNGPVSLRPFRPAEARQREVVTGANARVYSSGVVHIDADGHRLWDMICAAVGSHPNPAELEVAEAAQQGIVAFRPAREGSTDTLLARYVARGRGFSVALRSLLRELGIQVPRGQRWNVPVRIYDQDPAFGLCLALLLNEHTPVRIAERGRRAAAASAMSGSVTA